jgi:hypothetical protein
MDKPATYRIRVQGQLGNDASNYLQGMCITIEHRADQNSVAVLTGELLDQAALMGVLDGLYNFYHLPLLSVECISIE